MKVHAASVDVRGMIGKATTQSKPIFDGGMHKRFVSYVLGVEVVQYSGKMVLLVYKTFWLNWFFSLVFLSMVG